MNTWIGEKPDKCDLCQTEIEDAFVDGKIKNGPWAIMCAGCTLTEGVGLGEGKGQLYVKSALDVFVKMKG